MSLTPVEKVAGREFRNTELRMLKGLNTIEPPDLSVMSVWENVRHDCNGRSVALELRERYDYSPDYYVRGSSDGWKAGTVKGFTRDYLTVPAERFGFIWKEGRCSACGTTARSHDGRFVIADERPPRERSRHGGSASRHGGDSRVSG